MNRLVLPWWALLLPCLLSLGCRSFVPFTHELREAHELGPDEVAKLQFYISHDVALTREATQHRRRVDGGALHLSTDSRLEELVVKKLTPGTARKVARDTIIVGFGDGVALEFSLAKSTEVLVPQMSDKHGRFASAPSLLPVTVNPDVTGNNYWLLPSHGHDQVLVGGKLYEIEQDGLRAHLLIALESLEDSVETRTVLGGTRVAKH